MHIHNTYTQTDERKKCNRTKTLLYLAHVRTSVGLGLDVRVSAQRVLRSERGYVQNLIWEWLVDRMEVSLDKRHSCSAHYVFTRI